MRTIHTRTYTNVALTVMILLLLALALRPYVSLPGAYARSNEFSMADGDRGDTAKTALLKDPYADVAAALREVAAANRDIAAATRETAKAQEGVGKAIQSLGSAAVK